MLALPVTAAAATPRTATIRLSLSYSGTTATCAVVTVSDYSTDEITCVLKLWRGSTCIATWEGNGSGYLHMSKTKNVTSGVEYTLTADVVINGVAQPRASMTK
jgi:hypothetical protein